MREIREELLEFDPAKKTNQIIETLKKVFSGKGFNKAVIGLSGGIDSATVASLLVKTLGKDNVYAFLMPYADQDTRHAEEVADQLGIKREKVNIAPMVDAYFSIYPEADKVRRGNKMARERMSILFDQSSTIGALVAGTGNKTEFKLGYFTMHGDGACAVAPLSSLYKTQVFKLADYLGIHEEVIAKPPTAGLWEGQTDEGELGATYREIDNVLCLLDNGYPEEDIVKKGHLKKVVDLVIKRVEKNKFKLEGVVLI